MWDNIISWFGEMSERRKVIKSFNQASRNAFISGVSQTLLEAKITMGETAYQHSFSKFLTSGFSIKALSGRPLTNTEMESIGNIVIQNPEFVRRLVSLGWDTLYVYSSNGSRGLKWKLIEQIIQLPSGENP